MQVGRVASAHIRAVRWMVLELCHCSFLGLVIPNRALGVAARFLEVYIK